MSQIIAVKVKSINEYGSDEMAETLFSIVKEACNRRIAVKAFQRGVDCFELCMVTLNYDEILLTLSDSYNRDLANPLIGSDRDYEVKEYRPEPLKQRLENLQGLFEFMLNDKNVVRLDVVMDEVDLVFNDDVMNIPLKDFSETMYPLIDRYPMINDYEATTSSFHYQFAWAKK